MTKAEATVCGFEPWCENWSRDGQIADDGTGKGLVNIYRSRRGTELRCYSRYGSSILVSPEGTQVEVEHIYDSIPWETK